MFKRIRNMGMITSLDMAIPDPETPSGKINWRILLEHVLPYVDIFVPSIDELLYMWNREDYQQWNNGGIKLTLSWLSNLSQELIENGANIVMIKLGNMGLFLKTSQLHNHHFLSTLDQKQWSLRTLFSPCFKTKVIGTTGTGDATIAGFLSQIVQGSSPEEAMNIATATGASCVEARDATSGINSIYEIRKRINRGWEKQLSLLSTKEWQWLPEHQLWEQLKV